MGSTAPRYADGVLRVGDAAGIANPVNGEGLAAALTSGRLAAVAVAAALAHSGAAEREAELAAYDAVLARDAGTALDAGTRRRARPRQPPRVTRVATT